MIRKSGVVEEQRKGLRNHLLTLSIVDLHISESGLLPSSDVETQMNSSERAIFSHSAEHGVLRSAYFNLRNIWTMQMTISFPKKCYTSFRYQSSGHNLLGII